MNDKKICIEISILLTLMLMMFLLFSCKSQTVETEGMLPRQLLQQAQNELDDDRYERAINYYKAIIEKYPEALEFVIEAKYEIGHIYFKQRKYEKCKQHFTALLKEINEIEAREKEKGAKLIPDWPKVLVLQHLEKINKKEKGRRNKDSNQDQEKDKMDKSEK